MALSTETVDIRDTEPEIAEFGVLWGRLGGRRSELELAAMKATESDGVTKKFFPNTMLRSYKKKKPVRIGIGN